MDNSLKSVAYNALLQEWAERIKECRSSKLTVKAWCAENRIKLSTYYTWQKRVFNAVSSKMQLSTGNFAPVFAEITQDLPVAAASANVAATLRAGDFSIDIYDNASATFIESMLRGLKSC